MEKISYERSVYESVDDESLILGYISKTDEKKVSGSKGLIYRVQSYLFYLKSVVSEKFPMSVATMSR